MTSEAPDSVVLAESAARRTAVYVHIPFCTRVCPYCDFAVTADTSLAERYLGALDREIDASEPFDEPVAAVAIGGGTPTSIATEALGRILDKVERTFGLSENAEVSVEANPEDVTKESVDALAAAGVTRVSLGVQSFDDDVLRYLGRAHTAAEARSAVEACVDTLDSVNVDLIFGSPVESDHSYRESVRTALGSGIDHLSTYALTVERGTPLSRSVAAGDPAPDPDVQADRWEMTAEMAAEAGVARYEVSNHARPGHAVTYNLITWGQGEYAAFGNGAHRHRGGVRSWNVRRVDRYIERLERGESPVSGEERLGAWGREMERLSLGLRRTAGVESGSGGRRLIDSDRGRALVASGVVGVDGDRLRVRRPLLTDEVVRTLLALDPPEC